MVTVFARTLRVHVYVTLPATDFGVRRLIDPWRSQGCRPSSWPKRR